MANEFTYYRIHIGSLAFGHVDNKTVDEYISSGSIPSTLANSKEKEAANIRFRKIIERVGEKVNPIYISDIVRNTNNVNLSLTQFDFTLVYDRPMLVTTTTINGEPEQVGTTLTGIAAIKRWIERVLISENIESRLIYDPTLDEGEPIGRTLSTVSALAAIASIPNAQVSVTEINIGQ